MQHILKVLSFKLITLISFKNFNNNMLREDLNKFTRIMRFYKGSVIKRQTGQTKSDYEWLRLRASIYSRKAFTHTFQFVIFKLLSYCFEETIGFDVNASFASRSVSRLIRWYNKGILRKGYSVPRDFSWIENYKLFCWTFFNGCLLKN